MIAVGEIGLPYYLRRQMAKEGRSLDLDAYVQLLERFLSFAGQYGKPVVLHAVYEDADLACDLLSATAFARLTSTGSKAQSIRCEQCSIAAITFHLPQICSMN